MILLTTIIIVLITQNISSRRFFVSAEAQPPSGLLYPQESEFREVRRLDGMWEFRIKQRLETINDQEDSQNLDIAYLYIVSTEMPVPSSYNDITANAFLRDYVGEVWYTRTFFVPNYWKGNRVFVRFGSVHYHAKVEVNGIPGVADHKMGHLPFEAELTNLVYYGTENHIAVIVDNTNSTTSGDSFNYAGIDGSVFLYTKPKVYIDDITVATKASENISIISYKITAAGYEKGEVYNCTVNLRDEDGKLLNNNPMSRCKQSIKLTKAKLWWPRGMSPQPGYMYSLEVHIHIGDSVSDTYVLPFGIRQVKWNNRTLVINNKPIYLRGINHIEDSLLRGHGFDLVTTIKDFELLKWTGSNSFKTRNYPHSEEAMDFADKLGFMVIDECPAEFLETLQLRDKNRPSVIMWSIPDSLADLGNIVSMAKLRDGTRPITAVLSSEVSEKQTRGDFDIISFVRYNGWYQNPGQLDGIEESVISEATSWHQKYDKPVIMIEYGTDAVSGLHEMPVYVWSEEYQVATLSEHFKAFDVLKDEDWFLGEVVSNFADYRTDQDYKKVAGDKKGIFTRARAPKMAAHFIRKRYHYLGFELEKNMPPEDVQPYAVKASTLLLLQLLPTMLNKTEIAS